MLKKPPLGQIRLKYKLNTFAYGTAFYATHRFMEDFPPSIIPWYYRRAHHDWDIDAYLYVLVGLHWIVKLEYWLRERRRDFYIWCIKKGYFVVPEGEYFYMGKWNLRRKQQVHVHPYGKSVTETLWENKHGSRSD